jgi:hypothetical protein
MNNKERGDVRFEGEFNLHLQAIKNENQKLDYRWKW